MSPDLSFDQHVVTAVLVAHDGAGWIPRVAEGILQQTRPVQRAVAVDTGSRDRSGAMLAGLFGRPAVFGMERGTGYAVAVGQALRHRAASTRVPGGPPGKRTEWVWLLHDDCEPAPDALEHLLRAATETPAAAVLGPKVRDWTDRRLILEAGITIDRAGRRITGVEPREVDQGQHDGDRDVLAVSSAGMLIRRDVWDELGGFDPGMRLFREDADFCWRAQAAGHRVRLVTDAVVYHLEASARNRRKTSAAPRPRREDRRNALTTLLGNLPGAPMLRALAGNVVLSVLRTLFYLVAKRPGAGVDEITALLAVAGHPLRLRRARKPRAHGRRAAYARLRGGIPAGRTLGRLVEFLAAAWSKSAPVDTIGSHHATEDPSDDDSLLIDTGFAQRLLTSPGVLLFLGLTAIALVAQRSLLGAGPLGGGALTPAWGGASDLWQEYLQGFHPAGIGSAASTPPYVAVLAFLATLLAGKTWLAVDLLLIGCVPLAGLTAYLAARRLTRSMPARVWAAAAYALLPVGMGAVAAGRLGSAVVFVLLPLIGLLATRIFSQPRRRARRAAWAVALVTAIAAAFVPMTWLIVGLLVVAAGLTAGRRRPGIAQNLAIVALVPPVLLLPWSLQLAAHPASIFGEAGVPQPGLAQAGLPARSLLLLSPGGPGLPPFWVTAGLLLAALVTVVVSGRRPAVLAGWGVVLASLLTAAGVSQLTITPPGGGTPVPAWPGVILAFAGAGLVLAAASAADALPDLLRGGRWRSPAGLGAVLVALAACSAPAAAAASWVMTGVTGPAARVASPVLPEFVSVAADSGLRPRTLVLRPAPGGSVSYEVLRGADPLIGSEALTPPPAAQRVLDTAVATLAAAGGGEAQDQGQALASLGIGYVMLPAPGGATLARLLDGVPGLRPVSQTPEFRLWRVVGTPARLRVVRPGGRTLPVPAGQVGAAGVRIPPGGGELVLAEPAGGWRATLDGQPLTPLATPADGWAQAYRLPAGGGTVSISHSQLGRDGIVLLEALAVLAVAGLGLPGARVAGEEPGESTADGRSQPAGGRSGGTAAGRQAAGRGREASAGRGREASAGRGRATAPGRGGEAPELWAAEPGAGRPGEPGKEPAPLAAGQTTAYHPVQPDAGSRDVPIGRREDSGGWAGSSADSPELPPPPGAAGRAGAREGGRGARAAAGGGRPGKRPGGLLGRGRAGKNGQEDAAAAGPAGSATRAGRRLARGDAQPGAETEVPAARRAADDGDQPGRRRLSRGRGDGPQAGRGYPGNGSSGGYPGAADGLDGYGSGGHRGPADGLDGYGSGGHRGPAGDPDGYGSGGFPAGDDPAGAQRGGGRRGAAYDGYDTGGYPAGSPGDPYEPGGLDTGGYENSGYGSGPYGFGGYGAGYDSGGYPAGGYGAGDPARGAAGEGSGDPGAGEGRGYPGAGQERDYRNAGEDGGFRRALAGRGRRAAGGDGGERGRRAAGRGRGLDRRGGDRGAGQPGGGPAPGSRPRGRHSEPGGYPAAGEEPPGYRGYPPAGGESPAGESPAGEPPRYQGRPTAGGFDSGSYPAGEYDSGGYPAGGYDSGGYPAGEYGSAGHPTGRYDSAGGGHPGAGYRGGYPGGGYPGGGYPGDDEYPGDEEYRGGAGEDGPAAAGGGRGRRSAGRRMPGRGRQGRRPGRGDRR